MRKSQVLGGRAEQGGTGGGSIRKSQVRIRISQDRIRRATHSIRKNTMPIYGEISSIRGEPMSIRNQPCPQRDGGMEVDGDMEVGSIKIKTLSIKINTQPDYEDAKIRYPSYSQTPILVSTRSTSRLASAMVGSSAPGAGGGGGLRSLRFGGAQGSGVRGP